MRNRRLFFISAAIVLGFVATGATTARLIAQESSPVAPETRQPSLATRQDAIRLRYERFERTLRLMAEYLRKTDPERANLLFRAMNRSQEDRIAGQMEEIRTLLKGRNPRLGEAVERQDELSIYLAALLKLLQSEDRQSELEKQKAYIKDILKDVTRLIGKQKDAHARTVRGENPTRLTQRQQKIAEDTKKLEGKIDRQDDERNGQDETNGDREDDGAESKDKSSDDAEDEKSQGQPDGKADKGGKKDGQPNDEKKDSKDDSKGDDQKNNPDSKQDDSDKKNDDPSEKSKADGKPSDSKPQKGKPGKSGKPGSKPPKQDGSDDSPSDQKDSEQDSQEADDGSDSKQRTPGREEIERARQEMERAIKELKKQNHDDASARQDEAIAELQKAKEKLEEILRQLREEERELLLAALEARFQKMLVMQIAVYQGTVGLDKTSKKEWTSRHFGRVHDLAIQENDIGTEAAKALGLLREEGSSVAFPEAVEQLSDDITVATRRLEREETGELTQLVESDIIEALQEMVEALQKELEKLKQKKQQQQQNQQGEPPDEDLVDQLAELKMFRSLQFRINRRTRRLAKLFRGEQATEPDVVAHLKQLSRRQARIQKATYNLATGRNR